MADLPFSSRRRNNYAGSGRRIYANSHAQTGLILLDDESNPEAWADSRKQAGMGHGYQEGKDQMRKPRNENSYVQTGLIMLDDESYPEARTDSRKQAGMGHGYPEGKDQMRKPRNENKRVGIQSLKEESRGAGIEVRRKDGKGHVVASYASQEQDEDIKSAAKLLLARAGNVLFAGLCETCSTLLHHRLTSLVSGEGLTDPCTNVVTGLQASSDRRPADVSVSENGVESHYAEAKVGFESLPAKSAVESVDRHEVIVQEEDGPAQAPRWKPNVERRKGSVATSFSDYGTNVLIKSALHNLQNAPAYRTRSVARQAALLKTPGEGLESANDKRENARFLNVGRKKDFCVFEQVNGRTINILEGLELHTNILDQEEQKELIDFVYELQELGRNQKLRKRTYSEPRKWMRGKGRVTLQFGCCYNYAVDKDGNPPGIIREEEVDEIPPKLRMVIKRLVQWHVLPSSCIPDSCIVNIYDVGDCIPPHIDHHDFVRPFCTLSLLSECNIIFGTSLKIVGPGEFKGSISIPLPTGSVLILNGNGADVAKHAVPAVPTQRISITFRKMDPEKVPYTFRPDVELLTTHSLTNGSQPVRAASASLPSSDVSHLKSRTSELSQFSLDSDFPALGMPAYDGRQRNLRC